MEHNTPKQKWTLFASIILLALVVLAAIFWGEKLKPTTQPPPGLSSNERPTSITTMEGIIKLIAGGALYIEMDSPTEISAGALTPKKTLLVAFTSKKTEFMTNVSELPPSIDAPRPTGGSLSALKQGDRILVTSAVNLVGIPVGEHFDATRIEVIR